MGDTTTRVLLAVLSMPNPTIRSVAREVDRSIQRTHHHLLRLRAAGLVAWEPNKAGTLRATCRMVEFG